MKFTTDSQECELNVTRDVEDGQLLFILSMNQNRTFIKRLIFYIKYLFGYRCLYGDFDCLTISKKDAKRLMIRIENEQ